MRITVVTSLYPSRSRPVEGVFAERRWLGMRARGHAVRVIQPVPRASRWLPLARWRAWAEVPRHEERGGIPIERPRYWHWPKRARANAAAFAEAALEVLARSERPEVVVLDYAWPAAATVPELRARRIPCVVSGRGSDVLEVAGEAGLADELAFALRSAAHWCAVSRDLLVHMDRLGCAPGRGVLVPNGVDRTLFHPRPRAAARAALGWGAPGRLVLVCGHLIARKDPLLALEVFARGAGPEDRLVFLGRGPLEAPLRAALARPELASRVELRGEVPPQELAQWYAASDLVLLTSRREGRPNVVLEALASGRPVLATDAGGTAELLLGANERMLARTREPAALAQRLRALLDERFDPDELAASVAELSWDTGLLALERCLEAARAGEVERGP